MAKLFIANTQFEFELNLGKNLPLAQGFRKHPVITQLQFLPLLFGTAKDYFLVSQLPSEKDYSTLGQKAPLPILLDAEPPLPKGLTLQPWGQSPAIAQWAKQQNLPYPCISWDVIRLVNSKAYSFTNSPPLPGSKLLSSRESLRSWLSTLKTSQAVLKKSYGLAGRGMLHFDPKGVDFSTLDNFCRPEWEAGQALVGEPWVKRLADWSSQWFIHNDGSLSYYGLARMENRLDGRYVASEVGIEQELLDAHGAHIDTHLEHAKDILKSIQKMGYQGSVGIDALLYYGKRGETKLHPVVEINARQTMSLVALRVQATHFPGQRLRLSYSPLQTDKKGYLPFSQLTKRQLYLSTQD